MNQEKILKSQAILSRIKPHGVYSFGYICFILIVLLFVQIFGNGFLTPMILEGDLSISYPKSKETISSLVLFIMFCIIPAIVIVIVSYFLYRKSGPKLYVYYRFIITYIFCLAYTIAITTLLNNILKNLFVIPRPDFFSRCGYPKNESGLYGTPGHIADLSLCSCLNSTDSPCTKHQLADMYFSFPSGHSAAAGCLLMNLILTVRFLIQDTYLNIRVKYFIYSLTYFLGALAAILIGVTRVHDHRHTTTDISVGLSLGFMIGYIVYQFFFKLRPTTKECFSDTQLFCLLQDPFNTSSPPVSSTTPTDSELTPVALV